MKSKKCVIFFTLLFAACGVAPVGGTITPQRENIIDTECVIAEFDRVARNALHYQGRFLPDYIALRWADSSESDRLCGAQSAACIVRFWQVVARDNLSQSDKLSALRHELIHVVLWQVKGDPDAAHQDPSFSTLPFQDTICN